MEKFPSFSWCIDRRKTLAKTGVASVEMRVTYMQKSKVMATWASAGGRDRQRAEGERQGWLAPAVGVGACWFDFCKMRKAPDTHGRVPGASDYREYERCPAYFFHLPRI